MPAERAVRVQGLRELRRAFAVADKTLSRELVKSLKEAAEPVRTDAEELASSRIRNIGLKWSRMRVGITRHSVYVAPRQRGGRGRSRRNLAGLLMDRSMQPALQANVGDVERAVEEVLADVGKAWERA